jgi:predicted acetyltransferase
MPEILVRPCLEQDLDAYFAIRSLTYNDGLPIPEERRTSRFGERYLALLDDQPAGIFTALPMNATRGEALLPCAGVAGVAVLPDMRRGGVGESTMTWACRHFRESGTPLSSLYAYREPFYSRVGYATVGKKLRFTVPTHRLPNVASDLPVRRLTPEDWRELLPCYAAFGHQRSGTHVRSELMWSRVLQENKPLTIYAAGDPVQGYIAVSHQTAFWVDQWLSEVAWSTAEGYRAVLGIMRQLGINKTSMSWFEPSDSPFYAQYLDQGIEVKVTGPVMFRVCDVPKALESLKPIGAGRFTLGVWDRQIPENEGPWQVEWADGRVDVRPFAGAPEVVARIGAFSQAFMGEPNLADLARQGAIEVRSPEVLASALSLLPPLPVFCGDTF